MPCCVYGCQTCAASILGAEGARSTSRDVTLQDSGEHVHLELVDLRVGMRGADRDAQPRRCRARRSADERRRRESLVRRAMRRSRTVARGVADDDRDDVPPRPSPPTRGHAVRHASATRSIPRNSRAAARRPVRSSRRCAALARRRDLRRHRRRGENERARAVDQPLARARREPATNAPAAPNALPSVPTVTSTLPLESKRARRCRVRDRRSRRLRARRRRRSTPRVGAPAPTIAPSGARSPSIENMPSLTISARRCHAALADRADVASAATSACG